MAHAQFIEIPLPSGDRGSHVDVDSLKAMLHAIVQFHFQLSDASVEAIRDLERSGWRVQVGSTWLAACRRQDALEEATGKTPDEAVARLYAWARYETGHGCP